MEMVKMPINTSSIKIPQSNVFLGRRLTAATSEQKKEKSFDAGIKDRKCHTCFLNVKP